MFVQSDCLRCVFTPLLISTYLDLNFLRDLIDSVVAVAENTADEHIRNQGQAVTLEEDPQLQLPFLLPEDRYSCEVIRGVPSGLKEFLSPLAGIGECLYEKIKFWSGEKLEFMFLIDPGAIVIYNCMINRVFFIWIMLGLLVMVHLPFLRR